MIMIQYMKVYHLWHRGSVDKRVETKLAHTDESVFLNEQQMHAVLQNMYILFKTLIT